MLELGEVDPERREAPWRLGLDQEVSSGCERAEAFPAALGREVEVDAELARVVPPIEEPAGDSTSQWRSGRAAPDAHDVGSGLGQEFGREATAVVGQVEHAKPGESTARPSPLVALAFTIHDLNRLCRRSNRRDGRIRAGATL
jgi:hypothetical protein